MTWLEVEQAPVKRGYQPKEIPPVRVALTERKGRSYLWVTITNEVAAQIGWEPATKLGLSVGQDKFEGWIMLFTKRDGRTLKRMGKTQNVFTVCLLAPEAWQGMACESTEVEVFRPRAGELLIQIPWDFSEIETAAADQQEAA